MSLLKRIRVNRNLKFTDQLLFHSTNIRNGLDIIDQESIRLCLDSNFNENLLFLFYGIPAYISRDWESISSDKFIDPTVFVFKKINHSAFHAAFPFDTGGFFVQKYPHLKNIKDINCFRIESLDEVQQYIDYVYGNFDNYLNNKIREIDNSQVTIEFDALFKSIINAPDDRRRRTIEIQVSEEWNKIFDDLYAVIVSNNFMEYLNNVAYKDIKDKINKYNIKVIDYIRDMEEKPEYAISQIVKIAKNLCCDYNKKNKELS